MVNHFQYVLRSAIEFTLPQCLEYHKYWVDTEFSDMQHCYHSKEPRKQCLCIDQEQEYTYTGNLEYWTLRPVTVIKRALQIGIFLVLYSRPSTAHSCPNDLHQPYTVNREMLQ